MASRYWVGGTGTWDASDTTHWSATSNGAAGASAPTTADNVFIDVNSGSGTITTAAGATCLDSTLNNANITLALGANFTQTGLFTFTVGTVTLNSYSFTSSRLTSAVDNVRALNFGTGKIILSGNNASIMNVGAVANLTVTGSKNIEFSYAGSTGTRSVASASVAGGNTESKALNLKFLGGTDILSFNNARAHGTIDFDNFAGTCNNASFIVFGDFKISSGMTLAAGTGTITMSATSGTRTITTNGKTVDQPITFNGAGGTFAFTDALTQGSTRAFTILNGTVQLKNGVTSTVGSFVANNSNLKYLQSTTPGDQATLSQASGTVNVVDLNIADINAIGGATWNAYIDYENVDAGNNDGWNFGLSPPYETYEPPIIIRSFTQPRRF